MTEPLRFVPVPVPPLLAIKTVGFINGKADLTTRLFKHIYTRDGDVTGFGFERPGTAFDADFETRVGPDAELYVWKPGSIPVEDEDAALCPIYTAIAFQRADGSIGIHFQAITTWCPLRNPPSNVPSTRLWATQFLDPQRDSMAGKDPAIIGLTADAMMIATSFRQKSVCFVCGVESVLDHVPQDAGDDWTISQTFAYGQRQHRIIQATTTTKRWLQTPDGARIALDWLADRRQSLWSTATT